MEIINSESGVKIFLSENNKFTSCSIAVLIKRPLSREEVPLNALVPGVLGLGCGEYKTPSELNAAAERLFGGCFECVNLKKGSSQLMEFYAETPNQGDNIKNAVKFLGSLILNPFADGGGFKEEYVNREKQALKNIIHSAKDNKKEYAKKRLTEEMFSGEPFGICGDGYEEDIDKITLSGLYSHYEKIINSSPVYIIVSGSFGRDSLLRAINGLNLRGKPSETEKQNDFKRKETSFITEKMNVTQGKLCLGIRTKAGYYALLTANEIFGGGANSRLFMKAREKESLCYYISSSLLRFNKTIIVQSGVSSENVKKINQIIADEIKGFEGITEKEIKSAKESIIKKYTSAEYSLSDINNFCLGSALWGGAASLEEAAERVRAVKDDEVRAAFSDSYTDTIYFLKEGGL
ncbi:MAG: insulinase family protein [Clostridiales bacterium]|nr:insulinase family protein [Clostridiales bacterium]